MGTVDLTIPIYVDNDFGIDADGQVSVLSFVYVGNEDDGIETKVPFNEIIDTVIEVWRHEPAPDAISYLTELAHALHNAAEQLWSTADDMAIVRAEDEAEQFPEL